MKSKITFIGSGNVAWHLAKALDFAGYQIHQIVSRNEETGKALAKTYASFFDSNPENVSEESDFVFLTLPDKNIESTIQKINANSPVFMHCAGSVSLTQLAKHKPKVGVFYPLQTFTKSRKLNFFKIPIFIEASNQETLQKIWDLADSISNTVKQLDSNRRLNLHLAAVISNNFGNYLLGQTQKILALQNISMENIRPLVEETISKAFEIGPDNSQTGPAIRHDALTIEKHLAILEADPDLRAVYTLLTKAIQNCKNI